MFSHLICNDCQLKLDESFRFKGQITENQLKLSQLAEDHSRRFLPICEQWSMEEVKPEPIPKSPCKKLPRSLQNFPENRCPICSKQFKERRDIPLHIERVHRKRKDHHCDLCDYKCFKKFDMMLHHRNVHLKNSSLDTKVLCPICGRIMRNNSDLRRHQQKQHLMIKRYRCDFCEFASFERSAMKLHSKTHLARENRDLFPCPQCGKVLSTRNTLKAHVKGVHENIRSFGCSICPKSFAQKSCLLKHQKSVHERTKEHQCDVCNIFVSQACYLKKHKQMMHPPDGKKVKYPCEICAQTFSTEPALRNHLRIHQDPEFECGVCCKKFYRKGNLLDHMEHHESLPFPCQHCTRSFRNESKLNNHLKRVHFKEKSTYRCELCSSTFTRRTTYRDHVLRQHKDLEVNFCKELLGKIAKMLPEEQQRV